MGASVAPLDGYRAAQLAARAATGGHSVLAARAIQQALDDYVRTLQRQLRRLPATTDAATRAAITAAIGVNRTAARELEAAIAGAVREGRRVVFDETLGIWQRSNARLVASGVVDAALGAVPRAPITLLGAYEAVGASRHWRTTLRGYVRNARGEVDRLIRDALTTGVGPEQLARQLMPYVAGAEPFHRAFPRGVFPKLHEKRKMRRPRTDAERDAARKMRYNARRIAYSELHNARREAELQHFLHDPQVVAIRWTTAPDRGKTRLPDVCDALAWSNFYGMGRGVYPLDKVPLTPHPFDRCEMEPITGDPESRQYGAKRHLSGFSAGQALEPAAAARLQLESRGLLVASETASPQITRALTALGARPRTVDLDAPILQRYSAAAVRPPTWYADADRPLPFYGAELADVLIDARAARDSRDVLAQRLAAITPNLPDGFDGFRWNVQAVDDEGFAAWWLPVERRVEFSSRYTRELDRWLGGADDVEATHGIKSLIHELGHASSPLHTRHWDGWSASIDLEEGMVEWRAQEALGRAWYGGARWRTNVASRPLLLGATYESEVAGIQQMARMMGGERLDELWAAGTHTARIEVAATMTRDAMWEVAQALRMTPRQLRILRDALDGHRFGDMTLARWWGPHRPLSNLEEVLRILPDRARALTAFRNFLSLYYDLRF